MRYFAAGVKAAFSSGFSDLNTLEAAAFARAILPIGKWNCFYKAAEE
jgi:hypothetical protein